jgi:hypothetical protein
MKSEDKEFYDELIEDGNYLGAAQFLREIDLPRARRSAYTGKIVQAVIRDLGSARSKNDREKVVYLRSVLAWLLKEYPGLASIYREQLRLATGGRDVLPEFARGVRNMGDVLSGKKTVQEGMEDAAEPLESFTDQAGNFIRDGLNQVGEFFAGLNRGFDSDETGPAGERKAADAEEPVQPVDIKIEDADDPLPHDIHDADSDGDKADKSR